MAATVTVGDTRRSPYDDWARAPDPQAKHPESSEGMG